MADSAWDEYLRTFHRDKPRATDEGLVPFRSADGKTPYRLLADALQSRAGSRVEILDAMRTMLRQGIAQGKSAAEILGSLGDEVAEENLAQHLYTTHMPDPDLVIRTSGEFRISNFLLWQIAYSEIFVTERMWPDFTGLNLLEAIEDYQRRERRYGGLGSPAEPQPAETAPIPA